MTTPTIDDIIHDFNQKVQVIDPDVLDNVATNSALPTADANNIIELKGRFNAIIISGTALITAAKSLGAIKQEEYDAAVDAANKAATKLTKAQGHLTKLKTELATEKQRAAGLETDVVTLQMKLDAETLKVTNAAADLAAAEQTVATLQTELAAEKRAAAAAQAAADQAAATLALEKKRADDADQAAQAAQAAQATAEQAEQAAQAAAVQAATDAAAALDAEKKKVAAAELKLTLVQGTLDIQKNRAKLNEAVASKPETPIKCARSRLAINRLISTHISPIFELKDKTEIEEEPVKKMFKLYGINITFDD